MLILSQQEPLVALLKLNNLKEDHFSVELHKLSFQEAQFSEELLQ